MSGTLEEVTVTAERYVRASGLDQVQAAGCLVVNLDGHSVAIFHVNGESRRPSASTPCFGGTPAGAHVLVAAARYLAAHSPTVRAQGQTYQIARRLHRGERLYEE